MSDIDSLNRIVEKLMSYGLPAYDGSEIKRGMQKQYAEVDEDIKRAHASIRSLASDIAWVENALELDPLLDSIRATQQRIDALRDYASSIERDFIANGWSLDEY